MMKTIEFPKQYYPLLDPKVNEVVEPSGRCSAKTTSNEIVAINLMLQSKYNNIWYCRAEQTDIRDSIFSSSISTIQMMGLEHAFKWSLSPMRITCIETGAIMYFSAINGKTDDDLTATKGFTPQYKKLAMCILDEADQVKHENHITAWESTANRFLLPHGKMVYAYNPPMQRNHWAHTFFAKKVKAGAARVYATWEDIRRHLSKKTIASIERFKTSDPEYYKYWYLGQSVLFEGLIYPQFRRERHMTNIFKLLAMGDRVVSLHIGVDEATINDSTACVPLAIMASGRAVVLDCFENNPKKQGSDSPSTQSKKLKQFLDVLLRKFEFLRFADRTWIFDCAEGGQMLKIQFEQDYGERCMIVTNKSIAGDIVRVRSMLDEMILLFHLDVNVNTITLIEDIEGYIYDPKKENTIKAGQREDTIDALEYATKLAYNVPMRAVI